MGLLGITVAPEYGGSGQDALTETLVTGKLSRISPGLMLTAGAHFNLCAGNIHKNAGEDF